MSCIHYKFKSSLDYNSVTFDGLHLSLTDLKKAISLQKRLKPGEFDLEIVNAQTGVVYERSDELIAKNTSVTVSRVPVTKSTASSTQKSWEAFKQKCAKVKEKERQMTLEKLKQTPDLAGAPASEIDKIKAVIDQSTKGFEPSNFMGKHPSGVPAEHYVCKRCGQKGHYITNCPNSNPEERIMEPRYKRTTGIPATMLTIVDDPMHPGALLTSGGQFAVPTVDVEAYRDSKKERPPFLPPDTAKESEVRKIPRELLCNICDDLCVDAAIAPCCGTSFCDQCLREELLESEVHQCPACKETNVSPDRIVANKSMRLAVTNFLNDTGYTKVKRRRSNSAGGDSSSPVSSVPKSSALEISAPANKLSLSSGAAAPNKSEEVSSAPSGSPPSTLSDLPSRAYGQDYQSRPGRHSSEQQNRYRQGQRCPPHHKPWRSHNEPFRKDFSSYSNTSSNLKTLADSNLSDNPLQRPAGASTYDRPQGRSQDRGHLHGSASSHAEPERLSSAEEQRQSRKTPPMADARPLIPQSLASGRPNPWLSGSRPGVDNTSSVPVATSLSSGSLHGQVAGQYMGLPTHPLPILTVPPPGLPPPFTALPGFPRGFPNPLFGPPGLPAPGVPPTVQPQGPGQKAPLSEAEFYEAQQIIKEASRSPKKPVDIFDSFADLTSRRSRSTERHRSRTRSRSGSWHRRPSRTPSRSPAKRRSRSFSPSKGSPHSRSRQRSSQRSRSRSYGPPRTSSQRSRTRSPRRFSKSRSRSHSGPRQSRPLSRTRSPLPPLRRSKSPLSPLRRSSKSPLRRSSLSSMRRSSKSPLRRSSKSPIRTSKSPFRRSSKSPLRRMSKSPLRRSSKSPLRSSKSPLRRSSKSPLRRATKSPLRRSSKSPLGLRRSSKSPLRRSSLSPVRRSSRSSLLRSSKSPLRRSSKSPLPRRSRTRSKSFARYSRSRSKSWSKAKRPRSRSYSRQRSPRRSPLRSPGRRNSFSPRRRSKSFSPRPKSPYRSRSRSPRDKKWSPRPRSRSPFPSRRSLSPLKSPSRRSPSPYKKRPLSPLPPRRQSPPPFQRGRGGGFRGRGRGGFRGSFDRPNQDRFRGPASPPRGTPAQPPAHPQSSGAGPVPNLPPVPYFPGMGIPPPEEYFKYNPAGYQEFVRNLYSQFGPQAQAWAQSQGGAGTGGIMPPAIGDNMFPHQPPSVHPVPSASEQQRPPWDTTVPMSPSQRPRSFTPPGAYPQRDRRQDNYGPSDHRNENYPPRDRRDGNYPRERREDNYAPRDRRENNYVQRDRREDNYPPKDRRDDNLNKDKTDRERPWERDQRERPLDRDRDRRGEREREDRYRRDPTRDRPESNREKGRDGNRNKESERSKGRDAPRDKDSQKDKERDTGRTKDRGVNDRKKSPPKKSKEEDKDRLKGKDKKRTERKKEDKENKKTKKRSETEMDKGEKDKSSKKDSILSKTSPISDKEFDSPAVSEKVEQTTARAGSVPSKTGDVSKKEVTDGSSTVKLDSTAADARAQNVTGDSVAKGKKAITVKKADGNVVKKSKVKAAATDDGTTAGKKGKKTKKKKLTFGSSEVDAKQGLKKKKLKRLVDYKSENCTSEDGEDKLLRGSPAKKLKASADTGIVAEVKTEVEKPTAGDGGSGDQSLSTTTVPEVSSGVKNEASAGGQVGPSVSLAPPAPVPEKEMVTDATVDSTVKDVKEELVPELPELSKWEREDFDLLDTIEQHHSKDKTGPPSKMMLPRSVVDKAEKFLTQKPMKNAVVTAGHVSTSSKSPSLSPSRKASEGRSKSPVTKAHRRVFMEGKKESRDKKTLDLQITVKADKVNADADKSKGEPERHKRDSSDRKQTSSSRTEDSRHNRYHQNEYEEDQRSVVRSRSFERELHVGSKSNKNKEKEKRAGKQDRTRGSASEKSGKYESRKDSSKDRHRDRSPEPRERRQNKESQLDSTTDSNVKSSKDLRHKIEEKTKAKSAVDHRKLSVMDESEFVPDYEDLAPESGSDNEPDDGTSQNSGASSPDRKKRKKSEEEEEGDEKEDSSEKGDDEGGKAKKARKKHKHKEKSKEKKKHKKKKHKHKKSKDREAKE
ncbi:E3 ubiquitin-protein ligase RBBP6 isoform X2 [Aplysia californica]|uniref:E3 ubiquitin-protein ligase RBBP6 isoform X2 n=1 Tax=Aplysia californica TaxID=6500 RepID=A0ABM1A4C0_APLCA|nr:E3 ubiquitin-protein ligase RBBP6 isoform X2 [Aplysia californica]